jgi:type IV pilus assembly protein PilA
MIRRLRKQRGFTLVELMIVVAIIGILAALAVYGVKRYMTSAKTAEARETLGRIAKDATSAYQKESMAGTVLALGGQTAAIHRLCGSSSMVPTVAPAGTKFQSSPDQWDGDQQNGWQCLKFSMNDPQYFAYQYTSTGTAFAATAAGDLDGDSTPSSFVLGGAVSQGQARTAPTVVETNPDE